MRVAVFSDVHGNLTALDTVLAEIDRHQPDITVFAGDLCLFGARPVETLQRLRAERHILRLAGNADADLLAAAHKLPADSDAPANFKAQSAHWVAERLTDNDLALLESMAFSYRIAPTDDTSQDLVVAHANPSDQHTFIPPTHDEQIEQLGEVVLAHDEDAIRALTHPSGAGAVAFGHFHFPNIQRIDEVLLVNASSVANPMDRDTRSKFAVLDWNAQQGWEAQIVRVDYDREAERTALRHHQPPEWPLLERILDGELYLG